MFPSYFRFSFPAFFFLVIVFPWILLSWSSLFSFYFSFFVFIYKFQPEIWKMSQKAEKRRTIKKEMWIAGRSFKNFWVTCKSTNYQSILWVWLRRNTSVRVKAYDSDKPGWEPASSGKFFVWAWQIFGHRSH